MYIFLVFFFFYQITDTVLDTVLGLGDTILKKTPCQSLLLRGL